MGYGPYPENIYLSPTLAYKKDMPRHPVTVYFGGFSSMSNDNIFSKEQEDQIRKAFDQMDKDLGLDKLDDEQGLKDIMNAWEKSKQEKPKQ